MKGALPTTRPPIERILWIDARLRAGKGLHLQDICNEFEVHHRTAARDIAFLRDRLRAPIQRSRLRGYYYTDPTFRLGEVLLTEGELFALSLARQVLEQYVGQPYEQELRAAFSRLCQALPEKITLDSKQLEEMFSFRAEPVRPVAPQTLRLLQKSLTEGQRVWMRYYVASRGEVSERYVDPLHLHNYQGDWYLVAYDLKRKALRDFAVSRIQELRATGERAEAHPEFVRDAYLAAHFGGFQGEEEMEAVIRFDSYQARWIREKTWPGQLSQEPLEDGGLLLRLRVTNLEGLQRWVLQYGSHAEVLEPLALRERVAEEARKMGSMYKTE